MFDTNSLFLLALLVLFDITNAVFSYDDEFVGYVIFYPSGNNYSLQDHGLYDGTKVQPNISESDVESFLVHLNFDTVYDFSEFEVWWAPTQDIDTNANATYIEYYNITSKQYEFASYDYNEGGGGNGYSYVDTTGLITLEVNVYVTLSATFDGGLSELDFDGSTVPTPEPSRAPSTMPSYMPSTEPTGMPTDPSMEPSIVPSYMPSVEPTSMPSNMPTTPTSIPSNLPSSDPSAVPSNMPTGPTMEPTLLPTLEPTLAPIDETNDDADVAVQQSYSRMVGIFMLVVVISLLFGNN